MQRMRVCVLLIFVMGCVSSSDEPKPESAEDFRARAAQSEIELVCRSSEELDRPECRRDQLAARRVYEDFLREEAHDSIGLDASNVCLYKWSNYLDDSTNYVAANDCLREAIKVYRKPPKGLSGGKTGASVISAMSASFRRTCSP